MSGQPTNTELQEAIVELQQYLSDAVPPLVVADSIQILIKYPPEAILPAIRAWTAAQYRGSSNSAVPLSDFLFHAIKKIHMMGEFKLVPSEPLAAYLSGLKPALLALCPREDHAILLENLARLNEQSSTLLSPVHNIHRQSQTEGGPTASAASQRTGAVARAPGAESVAAEDAARDLRRFALLVDRLEAQGGPPGAAGVGSPAHPAAADALAFAARSSHSSQELDKYLARLKTMGMEAGTDSLMRALATSLPGWAIPTADAGSGPALETRALGAMRRIVTEAEDPVEVGKRFQELVKAGIERFNEGSLGQAVQMLELADRLIAEKKVDPGSAEVVRRRLGETLSSEHLRKFSERPDQYAQLRKVLAFFTAYTPEGLLEELPREQKRDRRRLLLALLEVHGAASRAIAYEALSRVPSTAVGEEEWYYRRNLLYLLRRIPRTTEASYEDESEVVARHTQLGLPLVVVKEAVAALAIYRDERTEQCLGELLAQLEGLLAKPEGAPYPPKDLRALLDRVAATMARLPSARARRVLIDHASRKQLSLGDAMSRLEELGSQDLSDDPETVAQLLALLEANLPFKVLGLTLKQNDQHLGHVVAALAGTPAAPVRRALENVVSRFGGQEPGRTASRALAAFDKPAAGASPAAGAAGPAVAEAPGASLQGDLEVFGLPALLQSLSDSSSSGTLTLRGPKGGDAFATLVMRDGKLEEIERGPLRGDVAFYQLFERPLPGQFAFVKGAPPVRPGAAALAVLPLTLEAMRRYDELQEAAVIVPDEARLEPTAVQPTPHPAEKDGGFLQSLWAQAKLGGTALEFEGKLASDSYRIRRLLAHWVEQGALKVRSG
jgi:hypothetical protein